MNKLDEILKHLAENFHTTVDKLYSVMLLQAQIELFSTIASVVITLGLILGCIYGAYKLHKWYKEDEYNRDGYMIFGGGALTVIVIFSLIFFFSNISQIPTLLFNPEYWVLRHVY